MAKGVRSKVKKRYRTAKRQRVEALVDGPRRVKLNAKLMKVARGEAVEEEGIQPKNKFMYPDDPEAEIPQWTVKTPIDFRAEKMPMAGYAFVGGRKKFTKQEDGMMNDLRKNSHKPQRIIAGKGFDKDAADAEEAAADEQMDVDTLEGALAVGMNYNDPLADTSDMLPSDHKRKPILKKAAKAPRARGQVSGKKQQKRN